MNAAPSARHTIGEWFGLSAANMSAADRLRSAGMALGLGPQPQCPFDKPGQCRKEGGVCSLRPHVQDGGGVRAVPTGAEVCAVCPRRLYEDDLVVRWVGKELLGTAEPLKIREVDFLQTKEGKAAGRIDMVLCDPRTLASGDLRWCIVETQAVYFSGGKMGDEFQRILDTGGSFIPFPDKARRPDFRSSGAKRLQPQLEAKCPTLRSWGKKLAVVVDRPFFDSLSPMDRALDNDDGEIIWFVVRYEARGDRYALAKDQVVPVALDAARKGLQNADPVSKQDFEGMLRARIGSVGRAGQGGAGDAS